MKKILIIQNDIELSNGVFDFVNRLNKLSSIFLTSLFLPQPIDLNIESMYSILDTNVSSEITFSKTINQFKEKCAANSIKYKIHIGNYRAQLSQIIRETQYSDLMVLSNELFFNHFANINSDIEENILHHVLCPVVLVPEKYEFPQSITIAFDRGDSSIFAAKQFAYLFPELCQLPTEIVYAGIKEDTFPNKSLAEELLGRRFPNFTLTKLEIIPNKYFITWLEDKHSTILVTGSYDRSRFSRFFKKSFVKDIVKEYSLPVFIAHKPNK